jgi:hypothetical protein
MNNQVNYLCILERTMTAKEINNYISKFWYERELLPWEHCAMKFYEIKEPYISRNIALKSIMRCFYKDEVFFFNIGIEEPAITKEMIINGDWQIYTWAD